MSKGYSKILFVGAKGEYQKMPFEILGNGQVDYTILQVGDPENSDDINKTFSSVEYYCLANNGQTWYFAISDGEVYYCRKIDPKIELKDALKSFVFSNVTTENFRSYFVSKLNGFALVEYGSGFLNIAEGRALPDARNYQQFKYFDFKYGSRSYSLDIFPDGETEWFETIFIPETKLTDIFKDSLRLANPEVQNVLEQSKTWKLLGIISIVLSILLIILAFGFNVYKQEIKNDTREITVSNNQEIEFDNFEIGENQLYTFETKIDLPEGKGVNLDISFLDIAKNPVSSTNQELYRYISTNSDDEDVNNENLSFFTEFFPKQKQIYTPVLKINDYGNVGDVLNTQPTPSCKVLEVPNCIESQEKLSIRMILYRGGVIWSQWIIASILVILISILSFSRARSLKLKAWE